jgi:hypothetical protein
MHRGDLMARKEEAKLTDADIYDAIRYLDRDLNNGDKEDSAVVTFRILISLCVVLLAGLAFFLYWFQHH